ncbi:MAG: hypothetical protein ACJ72L_09915 [Marmoricola sp.]
MRRGATRAVTVLLTATLAVGLGGCKDIPKSAAVKDFCSAGEKFSASTSFKQGVSAAKKLSDVGTPKGIPQAARDGFVQLIDRVLEAKNGQDFIKKSKKLDKTEQANLKALDAYIKKTCTA